MKTRLFLIALSVALVSCDAKLMDGFSKLETMYISKSIRLVMEMKRQQRAIKSILSFMCTVLQEN